MSGDRVRIGDVDVPLEVLELRDAMKAASDRYRAALAKLTPAQAAAVCGFNSSQQRLRARHRAGEHRPYHASCELCIAEGRYTPPVCTRRTRFKIPPGLA